NLHGHRITARRWGTARALDSSRLLASAPRGTGSRPLRHVAVHRWLPFTGKGLIGRDPSPVWGRGVLRPGEGSHLLDAVPGRPKSLCWCAMGEGHGTAG